MELTPEAKGTLFRPNEFGLFNASVLAKLYGKEAYGYLRSQKIKDLIKNISQEYGQDPESEFTDQGSIVRVISGGTTPGTWMHLDIFIKFLGWLDPKLERDFLKSAFAANKGSGVDPHQEQLAMLEADITTLKKKLSRNPIYKQLIRKEKETKRLQKEIAKNQKAIRVNLLNSSKQDQKLLE